MGLKKSYYAANPLLSRLSARRIDCVKKEYVFQKEQDSFTMALVLEGMIYLCVENESFERNILQFFRPGDAFSRSMLAQVGYGTSYLIAKTTSKIACFSENDLIAYCVQNPLDAQKYAIPILQSSETGLLSHNYILHQKTIRGKLTAFLKREMELQSSADIELPIPYSDLADYLAIDRTSMMKEIGKMKSEGLISGKNKKLVVHNL